MNVRLLKNGSEAFPVMLEAIGRASSTIALETYIFADDETGRIFRWHLKEAARRGLQVMVLVDSFGSWSLADSFWEDFRKAGGMLRWFRPITKGLLPFRNHRKLLLVDNVTAFVGSLNIADEYYTGKESNLPWRDTVLQISGVDAAALHSSFLRMWERALPPAGKILFTRRSEQAVLPINDRIRFLESGPENRLYPVRRIYREVIQGTTRSIDLAMSYFFPPGRVLRALRRAVLRGIRVRLLIPQKNDMAIVRWAAHGLYGRLLRAGVQVWEYTPTMLHQKLAIADDTVIAGSANLDLRSGRLNYELVVIATDAHLADAARADFEEDLEKAVPVRLSHWNQRPLIQKIKERVSYWLLARADLFVSRMEIMRRRW